MCGITGIYNVDSPVSRETLGRFNNALRHRGPDGEGYYVSPDAHLGLGHRRLAVIDLSDQGGQPMGTPDERYWITYNGAIYNYPELREELTAAGLDFRTGTDTEVVLGAYAHWGENCLCTFNGMWAFSIWDEQDRSLFLSRDRFGVKPLYYLHLPGRFFAFASETIAFRHLDGFVREFDEENIARCLQNPYFFEVTGKSLFKDIRQIPPGHWLKYSHEGGITLHRWWNTRDHLRTVPVSYEDQVQEFASLFRNACEIRLRSDVPFATALSGGVDSSSVYSMIRSLLSDGEMSGNLHPGTPDAFIATFPGTDVDEQVYADQVLDYFGTPGVHVTVDPGTLRQQILDGTLHGEYIDFMPPVFNAVYRAMREYSVIVSMGGHGSDEQLLGYGKYPLGEALSVRTRSGSPTKRELYRILSNLVTRDQWKSMAPVLMHSMVLEYLATILPRRIIDNPHFLRGMILATRMYRSIRQSRSRDHIQGSGWFTTGFDAGYDESAPEELPDSFSHAESSAYLDFHTFLLPATLRNWDRISMQYGIEERNPFLDWRLVCYVFSLPLSAKIGGGFTKRILRDAMKGRMPESIRTGRLKRPFRPPMVPWLNHDLSDFVSSEVNSPEFLSSRIWNGPVIRDYAMNHSGRKSWAAGNYEQFWYVFSAHLLLKYGQ